MHLEKKIDPLDSTTTRARLGKRRKRAYEIIESHRGRSRKESTDGRPWGNLSGVRDYDADSAERLSPEWPTCRRANKRVADVEHIHETIQVA